MSKNIKHIPKKSKMIMATAFLLGVMAIGGAGLAYADTSSTKTDPFSTLVTTIAQKFNLNQSDVQSVVDQVMTEEHTKMQVQHQAQLATRLADAVKAGTITQAQADLITAKALEMKTQMQIDRVSFGSLTDTERKAKMDATQANLKAWATANNIPKEFARFGFGGHGGPHGPRAGSGTN